MQAGRDAQLSMHHNNILYAPRRRQEGKKMTANYDQQLLALVAAASIDPLGFTPICYGCSFTRIVSGTYKVILPTGNGVVADESFMRVTAKAGDAATPAILTVTDESDLIKTIFAVDTGGGQTDTGLEVIVQRALGHRS
jgi:hypothetical protein